MPSVAQFRPWGPLKWVFDRLPLAPWQLLGCIGTEERSVAAVPAVRSYASLDRTKMLRIVDGQSRFSSINSARLSERTAEFEFNGGARSDIEDHSLMEQHDQIVSAVDAVIANGTPHIVVDITSMPKRFFFPILRRLLQQAQDVRSIVVVYTVPTRYTSEHLSESHNDWAHLPLFAGEYPETSPDMLIVSVGFEALGLVDQIEQSYGGVPIKLLVPFPAPVSAFARSLELTWRLQRFRQGDSISSLRADAKDASDGFTRLTALVRGGRNAVLAPFGPKPMSLAMCVFATLTNSPVFYCQPTVYHPDYSIGVSVVGGHPEIYGYCIRLEGRDLYRI